MARYYMMILAKNDVNLAADISKAIDPRYDSPLAACFYGANVKTETTKQRYYKEILPKVFGVKPPPDLELEGIINAPVGSLGLPYQAPHLIYDSYCFGNDYFYIYLPLPFLYLHKTHFSVQMNRKNVIQEIPIAKDEIKVITGEKAKIQAKDVNIRLTFRCEEDEIPPDAEEIVLIIKHDLFEYRIVYDIRARNGKTRNAEWYKNLNGKIYFILSPNLQRYHLDSPQSVKDEM